MIFAEVSNNEAILLAFGAAIVTGVFSLLVVWVSSGYASKNVEEANENALKIAEEGGRSQLEALKSFISHQTDLERVKARRPLIEAIAADFIETSDAGVLYVARIFFLARAKAKEDSAKVEHYQAELAKNPDDLAIYVRLRSLYARCLFLGFACSSPMDEYCKKFSDASTAASVMAEKDHDTRQVEILKLRLEIVELLKKAHA